MWTRSPAKGHESLRQRGGWGTEYWGRVGKRVRGRSVWSVLTIELLLFWRFCSDTNHFGVFTVHCKVGVEHRSKKTLQNREEVNLFEPVAWIGLQMLGDEPITQHAFVWSTRSRKSKLFYELASHATPIRSVWDSYKMAALSYSNWS